MPIVKPFDKHLDQYEHWFSVNKWVYLSELDAIRKVIPNHGTGMEIGIGSGLFAQPLGIREGIDPSRSMREKAVQRGLNAIEGIAEDLPYADRSWDFVLMVTTICFVDDLRASFAEAWRVLRSRGHIILGFVDKDSLVGKTYQKRKHESVFYKEASFRGTEEVFRLLSETGFKVIKTFQTVFGPLDAIHEVQTARPGHGEGSFVVISAIKKEVT